MPFVPSDEFPVDLMPSGAIRPLPPGVTWTGSKGDSVTIPAGRVSDLGTVPWLVRGVLPHDGKAARAFLVHDELLRLLREYREALRAWDRRPLGPPPVPPAFDSVDADAVFRVVLAELGVGPVRWIYWEGVRAAALWSPYRRKGWWRARSVVPFVLLLVPSLLIVLPAAVGALVSRALLLVAELVAWPWEARARRERARLSAEALRDAAWKIPAGTLTADSVVSGTIRMNLPRGVARAAGVPCPQGILMCPRDCSGRDLCEELADGGRRALTGTALDRAERDYFGADHARFAGPGDHAGTGHLVAFRAGWRRAVAHVAKSGESAPRTEKKGLLRRAASRVADGVAAVARGIGHGVHAVLDAIASPW